ncbi:MAG TPA: PAS domain-containing protein [Stellaceae bacterium]|nr:PAS domain-containing protein [Stellaceae bacterium]
MESIRTRLQPASQKLLAAWRQLPRPEVVPSRADFDPCDIASILPIISLIERRSPNEWRVRLAGTELERRWGRELSGLTYAEVLSPQAVEVTHCEFDAICRQPCGSWSLRHLDLRSGRRLHTETLRLPLRDKHGEVSLILSCNGELSTEAMRDADHPRQIITVFEQAFIDIGAGIPDFRCVPVAA